MRGSKHCHVARDKAISVGHPSVHKPSSDSVALRELGVPHYQSFSMVRNVIPEAKKWGLG